MIGATV
ncbi:unnamed protein product, partial [Rotaria sordida]